MIGEIKWIFFDMGNTLFDFHRKETDQYKDYKGIKNLEVCLNKQGIKISFEELMRGFYEPWSKVMEKRKITGEEYPIEKYLNKAIESYGCVLSRAECIELIHLFYEEYKKNLFVHEGVRETFENIKSKGIKIGIISNTPYYEQVIVDCFKRERLDNYVDQYTFSYTLGFGKPNKGIFEKAIEVEKIDPGHCIMVGDSLLKDIEPAKRIGMKSVWINRECDENKVSIFPDLEIKEIYELIKYI